MISTTPMPGDRQAADVASDEDIEDAWDQYEEEQEEESSATVLDRESSVDSASIHDTLQQLRQEFALETGELEGPFPAEAEQEKPSSFADYVAQEAAKVKADSVAPPEPKDDAGAMVSRLLEENRKTVTARQYQQATKLQVGSEIDEAGLSPIQFRIYAHLARRADANGKCFPSLSSICAQCQCRRTTAVEAIRLLEERKFISSERQYHRPTIYLLRPPQDWSSLKVE